MYSTQPSSDIKINDSIALNNKDLKSKKPYPKDFKNQVVAVYKSGIYENIEACAAAYDISSKTLYRWLDEYNKQTTPSALSDQKEEIAKLKKELAQAKMENEILKKAAIYFANQAR